MGNQKLPTASALTPFLDDSVDDGMLDSLDKQIIQAFGGPDAKPRLGQQIDARFVLEGELGQGGMGWVYSARHLATDGQVALKVMNPRLGPQGKLRFAMEARNAASLTHPNTVRVLDYGQDGELPFLVMEFLRGAPLDDLLKAQGRFSLPRAVSIASQILKSLWEAHDHNIVHRDIKASNVFLIKQQGTEDFVKVLDFGISQNLSTSGGASEGLIGSPHNMAPEQWNHQEISPQTDLYAVGCLVYQMLCGSVPFDGQSIAALRAQHLHEAPLFDGSRFADTSTPLHPWIVWMMAKAPNARPPSARLALQALQDIVHTDLISSPRPAAPFSLPEALPTPQPKLLPSPPTTQHEARHNLPRKLRHFVGREAELQRLAALLLEERGSLVTVVGMGGVGKTSLIQQFARRHLERWPGEIWFCDLTQVRSRDELCSTVAQVMGIKLTQRDHEEQLIDLLKSREEPLLLMDNFEQITHLAPTTIATWMAAAPRATFLTSSREPLAIAHEQLVRLSPFPLPPPDADLEAAQQNDAVVLFAEKARKARPSFTLTAENLQEVIALVRQLDGLPLALELAAARVAVLTPAQIVARLSQRFQLLRSRQQDAASRQATLKSTLDWSWELLSPWEQEGLLQCSIFHGSFTLNAAEAVLDLSAWPDALWTVDLLQNLLDKSWLTTAPLEEHPEEQRFTFYVSIREYALHKRAQRRTSAEADALDQALTRRHAEHYGRLDFNDAPWERNQRHDDRSIKEFENFLAIAQGPHREQAYRATLAVVSYYHHFGPYKAALNLLRPWLEDPPKDPHQHLRILLAHVYLSWSAGSYDEARTTQALTLAQDLNEPLMEGWAWLLIALKKHMEPNPPQLPCPEIFKALASGQTTQSHILQGWTLFNLGIQHRKKGESEQSMAYYQQALHHARNHPSLFLECMTRRSLGVCLKLQGQLHEAADHFLSALELANVLGHTGTRAWILRNLSSLYDILGDHDQALRLIHRARALARRAGSKRLEGWSCLTLGVFCANQGQRVKALEAFAQGLELAEIIRSTHLRGDILGEWALIDLHMDNLDAAQHRMKEGVELVEKSQDQYSLAMILSSQATLQFALGQPQLAAQTLARVEAIHEKITADPRSILGRRLQRLRRVQLTS
ncbi:MAG: hypothetical protein CMH57_06410 [Myxococcales bacterium]|nr:hypothetical protein [Myxococcales bacterium]